jgi:YEATS domain-containing protein 4
MTTWTPRAEISRPFVVGSVAWWQGPEAESTKTHKWTVFLRALDPEEDMGFYIDKVVFVLHESFEQSVRGIPFLKSSWLISLEVLQAPFQVSEVGWGEFSILIRVHFKDDFEKPVEFPYYLRLYDNAEAIPTHTPVVSELYDEFVFLEPDPAFWRIVEAGPSREVLDDSLRNHYDNDKLGKDEEAEMVRLLGTHQHVLQKLIYLKKRLDSTEEDIQSYKTKIDDLITQQQSSSSTNASPVVPPSTDIPASTS